MLEALAATYLVPFTAFFTGNLAATIRRDFRRAAVSPEVLSYDTLTRLGRFDGFYEVAARLTSAMSVSEEVGVPPFAPTSLQDAEEVERAGRLIRYALGIRPEDQRSWDSEDEALQSWVAAIEVLGVFVFRIGMDVGDIRGVSRWDHGGPPVILLNTSDTKAAQTFTALHELAHLMLRSAEVTNLCDISRPSSGEERFVNRVAAAALVPREMLVRSLPSPPASGNYYLWPSHLRLSLRKEFRVSQAVLGIRLEDLEIVEESGYEPFWRKTQGFGRGRPQKRWQRTARYIGARATGLARRALTEERVSSSELSRMLGVKASEIEQMVS